MGVAACGPHGRGEVPKLPDRARRAAGQAAPAAQPSPAPIAIGIFDPAGHLPLAGEEPRGIQKKIAKRNSGEGEGGGKRRAWHEVFPLRNDLHFGKSQQ
jgi:hypothetical protein